MVEAVVGRLADETGMSITRLLGYAHRRVLRVDHRPSELPDDIIREIDPLAGRLSRRPVEAPEEIPAGWR